MPRAAGDPIGDADVLADLGTPADRLLKLCAEEGQLPADILVRRVRDRGMPGGARAASRRELAVGRS